MKYNNLKKLFLVDGLGAILSAFLLGVVLVKFEWFFGIPKTTLYFLAALPIFFAIYDFYCFLKIESQLNKYLKAIAVINLCYCCLSLGLAFYHFDIITTFGWIYIIGEILIVVLIAIIELRAVNHHQLLIEH